MSIVIGRRSTIIDFYPFLLHGFKGFKFPWEGVVDRKWHRFYECYGLSIKKNQKKSNRVRKYIWHFNYLLNNIIDIIKYICYSYIALFDITFIDMNNSIQRHHSGNSHEWLSAIFTFLVLSWVYFSMWNFSSSAISYGRDDSSSGKILSVNTPYWNDSLSYGFRSASGDTYIQTESTKDRDRVLIAKTGTESEVYEKDVLILVCQMGLLLLKEISILLQQKPSSRPFIHVSVNSISVSPRVLVFSGSFLLIWQIYILYNIYIIIV